MEEEEEAEEEAEEVEEAEEEEGDVGVRGGARLAIPLPVFLRQHSSRRMATGT